MRPRSSSTRTFEPSPSPPPPGTTTPAPPPRRRRRRAQHAMCLEALAGQLRPGARALDVGSGSGYLAACMAVMVGAAGKVRPGPARAPPADQPLFPPPLRPSLMPPPANPPSEFAR